MLDTHGRKFVQPIIKYLADRCIRAGLSANQVTIIALLLGLSVPLSIHLGYSLVGAILLWVSGLLDAVDGTIARLKGSNLFGALMDITFDRIVEIGIILVLAVKYPENNFLFLLLASSIIISMTIFLTVGTLSTKISEKSFYYQPGLAERTEGFIFFTGMILFPQYLKIIVIIFILIIIFTAGQRMAEARKILK
ncbi:MULTISPECIES: CDP-alcohol phosphatidyltransferase family protein [Psychrilyobacter]|uniref:CDP-alcohol phosphatidyltransferase family protein n=1 Tax=Psychrilyobacter piezotolerans TaxID=2293438 RepID=A0ABX9KIS5_9FUSO|nr:MULTISPECIES: CDP-alcohol phosphatidyltransferase family protein [Psychrilyobacter]MCS5423134.1 CDP-alcohol phosphatidyltransferase family protein [Psychrilyobacter sp. S5]NDI77081.1 CDP-alcohol phosphatidyltransferase family protein [Psychrilyobacter piezotolerans]RDE64082.1 CDP-alcohol phosphatidyltransferase family protein [Psychrilyobacter sp. S5]REI42174.1 CDP-alcohol phosphatidyltransferase family protein [Psychrilyobacter piezotolerans]